MTQKDQKTIESRHLTATDIDGRFRAAIDFALARVAVAFGVPETVLRAKISGRAMATQGLSHMPTLGRSWTDDMLEAGREHQSS